MPRGYPLASGTVCPFAQDTFLEKRIAHHTRIWGTPAHVFIDKVLHDDFPELFTHIGYMMHDAEAGSYGLRFHYLVGLFLFRRREMRGDIPTTSYPCSCNMMQAAELSIPPLIPTNTRLSFVIFYL